MSGRARPNASGDGSVRARTPDSDGPDVDHGHDRRGSLGHPAGSKRSATARRSRAWLEGSGRVNRCSPWHSGVVRRVGCPAASDRCAPCSTRPLNRIRHSPA